MAAAAEYEYPSQTNEARHAASQSLFDAVSAKPAPAPALYLPLVPCCVKLLAGVRWSRPSSPVNRLSSVTAAVSAADALRQSASIPVANGAPSVARTATPKNSMHVRSALRWYLESCPPHSFSAWFRYEACSRQVCMLSAARLFCLHRSLPNSSVVAVDVSVVVYVVVALAVRDVVAVVVALVVADADRVLDGEVVAVAVADVATDDVAVADTLDVADVVPLVVPLVVPEVVGESEIVEVAVDVSVDVNDDVADWLAVVTALDVALVVADVVALVVPDVVGLAVPLEVAELVTLVVSVEDWDVVADAVRLDVTVDDTDDVAEDVAVDVCVDVSVVRWQNLKSPVPYRVTISFRSASVALHADAVASPIHNLLSHSRHSSVASGTVTSPLPLRRYSSTAAFSRFAVLAQLDLEDCTVLSSVSKPLMVTNASVSFHGCSDSGGYEQEDSTSFSTAACLSDSPVCGPVRKVNLMLSRCCCAMVG